MILQIENVYPAGVMLNSYFLDKFPTLLLKMSEAANRNNRVLKCHIIFPYFSKVNLHPDPARPLKVTVMIKENQMPKIPKRFRTLWFFTGANMLNDYFWNDWKGEQTNVIFNSIDFFHATLRNVQSY